jgi:hypothetical protein
MLAHLKTLVAACVFMISLCAIGASGAGNDRQSDPRVSLLATLLGVPACVASVGWLCPGRAGTGATEASRPAQRRRAANAPRQPRRPPARRYAGLCQGERRTCISCGDGSRKSAAGRASN